MASYYPPQQILKEFNSDDYSNTTIPVSRPTQTMIYGVTPFTPIANVNNPFRYGYTGATTNIFIAVPVAVVAAVVPPTHVLAPVVVAATPVLAPVVVAPTPVPVPVIDETIYVTYTKASGLAPTTVTFSVASITSAMFSNTPSILSLTYNGVRVTSLIDNLFSTFTSLTTLIGFNSVLSIGNGTFSDCANLSSIPAFNSVTSMGNNVFYNCHNLANIGQPSITPNIIFNSLLGLGNSAFYNCNQLTSLNGFGSIVEVNTNAFFYCSGIKTITGFDLVTKVDSQSFAYCASLAKPAFINVNTIIDPTAFIGCNFTVP